VDEFRLLKLKIKRKLGINVEQYRESFLRRRVNTRLYANGLENCVEYLRFLEKYPEEYQKLAKSLTINVSEFFRDKELWEEIEKILRRMVRKKTMIRAWSAGCATGEEAYSFTILLNEILKESINDYYVRIYATDLDEKAIEFAKKAVYRHFLKNQ
jgi:Methylase of chemotaxis methyl-accepting proteins